MPSENRTCQVCRGEFTVAPEDFSFYEKMGVPAPSLCPTCRFKRRAQFRNERTLYNRSCDKCAKSMITMYHPKAPYKVYCNPCFDSDTWDPFEHARDYDLDRPFFDQLDELLHAVPKKGLYISAAAGPSVNSDYINMAGGSKNCYLIFNGGMCEDCMYGRGLRECREAVDIYYGSNLERCYETVNVQESSGIAFGQNVIGSIDSIFLLNCSGVQNCFGCVNLRHKSYHFFNEPLSKEEYAVRVNEIMGSHSKIEEVKERFKAFTAKFPARENANIKAVQSTGDLLFETKNAVHCFEGTKLENCKYAFFNKDMKDSYDTVGYGWSSELLLEVSAVGYSSRVIGSYGSDNSQELEYCFELRKSKNCFGCDSLKDKRYCILNKQYSKEEYERLRDTIIAELKRDGSYGLSLPPALSPWAYNETVAQDNFPLTKEETLAQGFKWQDEVQITLGKETMVSADIPDHIRDVPDSILNEILACINCSRNYRIIKAELEFYRKMNLPLPRRCFNCRFLDRINRRGPFHFFDRACGKCNKPIQTTLSPEHVPLVYCEQCYQAEVV